MPDDAEDDTDPDRMSSPPDPHPYRSSRKRQRYSRTPRPSDSLPATNAAMRELAIKIVGAILPAGLLGAVTLTAGSYMALHDVQRDVEDVRLDYVDDMTRVRGDVVRRHAEHSHNGHRNMTETLHSIDLRLTAIEEELRHQGNEE